MQQYFNSKLAVVIYVLAIIGLSAWAVVIYRDRNTKTPSPAGQQQQPTTGESDASPSLSATDDLTSDKDKDEAATNNNVPSDDANNTADENQDVTNAEPDTFLDVTTQDCDNNCKSFSDAEDLKYCQNVCGLNTPKKTVSKQTDCASLDDSLEQDYCYKDLAISKKDMKICDNIADTNVKKTCTNRITEDIIDAQVQQ